MKYFRLAALLILAGSCRAPNAGAPAHRTLACAVPVAADIAPDDLHILIKVSDKLISGSAPHGEKGFDAIAAMGVKTIISVDAKAPDVNQAKARGLRYVHLPIGYHGIEQERRVALSKALHELPGPIYMHCHHGKHRGPAAAAVAAVAIGELSKEEGLSFLRRAGTSPDYPGLYASVAECDVLDLAELERRAVELPEIAPMPGFVVAMADAQTAYDHLVEIGEAGWRPPRNHPDLIASTEAERLEQFLGYLVEHAREDSRPESYQEMMVAAHEAARELNLALESNSSPHVGLHQRLRTVGATCKACHIEFRNQR